MKFFRHGPVIAWMLIIGIIAAVGLSVKLLHDTAEFRFERDVNRTFPQYSMFSDVGSIGQTSLFRVLVAYRVPEGV